MKLARAIATPALPLMGLVGPGAPPASVAPTNSSAPAISGTPQVGLLLTASSGVWSGNPTPIYSYQWNRAGSAISGQTSSTYTVVTADIGQNITVTVTATNTAGSASATSAAVVGQAAGSFSPSSLFSSGQKGVWYDFSDLTTLFQDAAGTIAVTAVEQPVGRILDKSGRGNHATQSTAAARPVLSARYNQLTRTEDFSNAAWTKTNVTPTQVSGEVWELDEGTATGNHAIQQVAFNTSQGLRVSLEVKAGNASPWVRLTSRATLVTNYLDFNLDTLAQVTDVGTTTAFSNPVFTVTPLADGWYRLEISCTSVLADHGRPLGFAILDASRNLSHTGTGRTVLIRRPSATLGQTDGVGLPSYQRVTTAADYDTTGFPLYLRGDGVDDALVGPAISNIITASTYEACIGARFNSVTTNSASPWLNQSLVGDNGGAFGIGYATTANVLGAFNYDNTADAVTVAMTPPSTFVLQQRHSAGNLVISTNGGTEASVASGNTSSLTVLLQLLKPFGAVYANARLYGVIIRETEFTSGERASVRDWMNSVAKAY